jgi:hypothetical protein
MKLANHCCNWSVALMIICTLNFCTGINDGKHLINYNISISKNHSLSHYQRPKHDNFLIIDHLDDNEKETRIKWKNLLGKETTLDMNNNERFVNR